MFLLAFYLLLLPLAGIGGITGCDELEHARVTLASGADHTEDHAESCAPFCNCSCCFHVASSHFGLQKITPLKNAFLQADYPSYPNDFYPRGIYGSIWQPPQA